MHPIKHFLTITKHRHKVIAHCAKAGILWQGLFHDMSKYLPVEFIPGAKYYKGTGSPNVGERRENGYSLAWLHHKGVNKHHFEYWTDYSAVERRVVPIKMPLRYVAEMFCDRVAASKIYNGEKYKDGDSLEYFLRSKPRRFIHEETSDFLEKLLTILAEEGEEKAFLYIRDMIRKKEEY
ncbi:MAG: catalase [Clostridia bacterium]|nr:catalase [Clostridia bacterium]